MLTERPTGAILAELELPGLVGERDVYKVWASDNQVARDEGEAHLVAVLFAGPPDDLLALQQRLAGREGPVVPIFVAPYPVDFLPREVSLSVKTAAAGGNASLMTIA